MMLTRALLNEVQLYMLLPVTDHVLQGVQRDVEPGSSMAGATSQKPSWEKELVLPKHPFPNKLNAFTVSS